MNLLNTNTLVTELDWYKRLKLAKKGLYLDVLKDDPDWAVRVAVARSGYALDKLKDDTDRDVRKAARIMLEKF